MPVFYLLTTVVSLYVSIEQLEIARRNEARSLNQSKP